MWQLFIIPAAFVAMSVIGFALMGADKRRAEKGAWRIPEKVLFGVSFLLGGVGSLVGMFVFRHKTKHASFRILLPLSALWSLAVTAAAEYGVWLARAAGRGKIWKTSRKLPLCPANRSLTAGRQSFTT